MEPTGKSVDLLDVVDRFNSTCGVDDAASFSNCLAQGDSLEDDGKYVSSLFTTSRVNVSNTQVDSAAALDSSVSFSNDIAGSSFGAGFRIFQVFVLVMVLKFQHVTVLQLQKISRKT